MQPPNISISVNQTPGDPNPNQAIAPTGNMQGRNIRELLIGCSRDAHVLRAVVVFLPIAILMPEAWFSYGIYKCGQDRNWEYCTLNKRLYEPETGRDIYIALAVAYPLMVLGIAAFLKYRNR